MALKVDGTSSVDGSDSSASYSKNRKGRLVVREGQAAKSTQATLSDHLARNDKCLGQPRMK